MERWVVSDLLARSRRVEPLPRADDVQSFAADGERRPGDFERALKRAFPDRGFDPSLLTIRFEVAERSTAIGLVDGRVYG